MKYNGLLRRVKISTALICITLISYSPALVLGQGPSIETSTSTTVNSSQNELQSARLARDAAIERARKAPEAVKLQRLLADQKYFMEDAIRRSNSGQRRDTGYGGGLLGGSLMGGVIGASSRMGDNFAAASTARKYKRAVEINTKKLDALVNKKSWALLSSSEQELMIKHLPNYVRDAGAAERLPAGTVLSRPKDWVMFELPTKDFTVWMPGKVEVYDVSQGKLRCGVKKDRVTYEVALMQIGKFPPDEAASLCKAAVGATFEAVKGSVEQEQATIDGDTVTLNAKVTYNLKGAEMLGVARVVFNKGNLACFIVKLPQEQEKSGEIDWFLNSIAVIQD